MQTEDPLKVTAGRSKPVSSSANTPGSRVHLRVWAMLYFCLRVDNPPNVSSASDSVELRRPSFTLPHFVFGFFHTKCFPNICTTDSLVYLYSHSLSIHFSFFLFQADIYSYLCDKSHASTMTADDYGKMGGVEVRRWEDSGGLWTASCWGKIQK